MLEYEEFRRAIRKDGKMSPSMLSNEDIKFLFDRVDNDQSAYIDIDEFVEWVEQSDGQPEEGFTSSSSSSSFSSSPSGGRRQSMSSGYGQNGPTALQVPRGSGSGGKRGSSEKKIQKNKPVWSAHVRRMSTFENSPTLARSNFQKESLLKMGGDSGSGRSPSGGGGGRGGGRGQSSGGSNWSAPAADLGIGGRGFAEVSDEAFDLDRRRAHRDRLAKKAAQRKKEEQEARAIRAARQAKDEISALEKERVIRASERAQWAPAAAGGWSR